MPGVFVGRQPIYDRQQEVFAYELLFRNSEENRAQIDDPDRATSELIINALTELDLNQVIGDRLGFINLTRNFITGILPMPGPAERLVLEVLEDIALDDKVLDGIRELQKKNYTIALDDFIFHPHLEPLVAVADIVKIDIMAIDQAELAAHVQRLKKYPVKLLAEKVETHEEHQYCLQLGFDYFQGYFYAKPNIMAGKRTPANRLALLQLLGKISDSQSSIDDIEQMISRDVTLSYRLLRYINSSQYSLNKKIDSVKSAIMLLGVETVRSIASLIIFTTIDDKPFELFVTALIRAHMCELFAKQNGQASQAASYFTAGLFSTMDAIMDMPLNEIINQLPLNDTLTRAILEHQGMMGQALQSSIAFQQGNWATLQNNADLDTDELQINYLSAIAWCNGFVKSMCETCAA